MATCRTRSVNSEIPWDRIQEKEGRIILYRRENKWNTSVAQVPSLDPNKIVSIVENGEKFYIFTDTNVISLNKVFGENISFNDDGTK